MNNECKLIQFTSMALMGIVVSLIHICTVYGILNVTVSYVMKKMQNKLTEIQTRHEKGE